MVTFKCYIAIFFMMSLVACSNSGDRDGSSTQPELNSNVEISNFSVSIGNLVPAYSDVVDNYTVNLKNRNDTVSLNLTSSQGTTFTVNGAQELASYPLSVGSNVLSIVATSEDASSQRAITLTVQRARQFVYVSNVDTGSPSDTLSLFSINPANGQLEVLPTSSVAVGDDPYDLLVSPLGNYLYVANAGDDTISQFTINTMTGALTAMTPATVSTGNTPYGFIINSDESSFYIPMGGETSPGLIYNFDMSATGVLSPMTPATTNTGNNPWFMAITPDDRFVYTTIFNGFGDANPDTIEMHSRNAVTGQLSPLTPVSVATGDKPWHINVHPNGQFLYNTNYGSNTVTAYAINSVSGQLTQLPGSPYSVSANPIGLSIDPLGRFLYVASNGGGTVSMFAIDGAGALSAIGGGTVASAAAYGLEVDNTGNYLYVANTSADTVSMFSINQTTGDLTPLTPATISTGSGPRFVRISR